MDRRQEHRCLPPWTRNRNRCVRPHSDKQRNPLHLVGRPRVPLAPRRTHHRAVRDASPEMDLARKPEPVRQDAELEPVASLSPRRASPSGCWLPGCPLCDQASAWPRLPHLTAGETKKAFLPFPRSGGAAGILNPLQLMGFGAFRTRKRRNLRIFLDYLIAVCIFITKSFSTKH